MKIANGKGDKEKETTKSSTMMSCFVKSHKAEHDEVKEEMCKVKARKPGGWKSMPYILGNETFERLATIGVLANFMVYLQTQLHMKLVAATNLINIWSGCSSFAPLLGAFISDAYLGRFRTIAFASIASLLELPTEFLTTHGTVLHDAVTLELPSGEIWTVSVKYEERSFQKRKSVKKMQIGSKLEKNTN